MKILRYGIIGCGTHALRAHAKVGVDGLELGAIFEINPDRVHEFLEGLPTKDNIRVHESASALVEDETLHGVLIASPDKFHLEHATLALTAGKHVFAEKPLATTPEEYTELTKLIADAKARNLLFTTCHPRRFGAPLQKLKELMDEKTGFGMPVSFHYVFHYHEPSAEWKKRRSLMLDHLNHEIDTLHFLFGPRKIRIEKIHDGAEQYEVWGCWGEITFHFIGLRMLKTRQYVERMEIIFERGTLSGQIMKDLEDPSGTVSHGVVRSSDFDKSLFESFAAPYDYDAVFRATMQNFRDSMQDPTNNYLSAEEMLINTHTGIMLMEHDRWESA